MDFKREIVIFLEENGEKYARAVIRDEGGNRFNIVHVFVSNEHRGEGLAGKLTQEAIQYIKDQGGYILADCSYADSYMKKHNIDKEPSEVAPSCSIAHMREDQ